MRPMKTPILRWFVGMVLIGMGYVVPGEASPRGGSNSAIDFFAGESNKDNWAGGLYFRGRERPVSIDEIDSTLDERRLLLHVGYHLADWLTAYGMAGISSGDLDSTLGNGDGDQFAYGFGLSADVFHHEIQDPLLMEDSIRVNAAVSYQASSVDGFRDTYDFNEVVGSLTISIVNEVSGSVLYWPDSIALFAGPVYSRLVGGDIRRRRRQLRHDAGTRGISQQARLCLYRGRGSR